VKEEDTAEGVLKLLIEEKIIVRLLKKSKVKNTILKRISSYIIRMGE
jgi:hypothetical protein